MRIVYLGTPDFAVAPLKAILGYKTAEVVGVVCNKDKPVGRKKILTPPPVKVVAEEFGIPVFQYDKIRKEGAEDMRALKPDLMITCAFGQILSQELIDIPRLGVINIHASLLPAYRGASPINYALLSGEKETGITIMRTDIGIDTGDILLQKKLSIGEKETAGELFSRLSVCGAEAITQALPLIENGTAVYRKQNEAEATFTKIIKKEDAEIDFSESSERVVNKVRAFNPAPVAYTFYNGEPFKVYEAQAVCGSGQAGTIIRADKELVVATGDGAVRLSVVQKAGGKAMKDSDFLRGAKLSAGERFGK